MRYLARRRAETARRISSTSARINESSGICARSRICMLYRALTIAVWNAVNGCSRRTVAEIHAIGFGGTLRGAEHVGTVECERHGERCAPALRAGKKDMASEVERAHSDLQ